MSILHIMIEITGWVAVCLYVIAYFLLSTNKLSSGSYLFHALNILGATGLIINAFYHHDNPNLVVNVIWFIIGAGVIIQKLTSRSGSSDTE